VPDDVLIKIAQTYWDGTVHVTRVDRYKSLLNALQDEFADDEMVDVEVGRYYAKQYMGSGNLHLAISAVELWKHRFRVMTLRYGDSDGVDEAMLRDVAMIWPNAPQRGIRTILMRRRGMLRPLEHGITPERGGEPHAEPSVDKSEKLLDSLATLKENDRLAVLLIFGLYESEDFEAEEDALSEALGVENLAEYVEQVLIPKIQKTVMDPGT
jgi:hypothetical protein